MATSFMSTYSKYIFEVDMKQSWAKFLQRLPRIGAVCAEPAGIHRHAHPFGILPGDFSFFSSHVLGGKLARKKVNLRQYILSSLLGRVILKAELEAILPQEGNQRCPVMTQERRAAPQNRNP